jgi:hypothetical protein
MKIKQTQNTITLTFDAEIDADHVMNALQHQQWLQATADGSVRFEQTGQEPKRTDHEMLVAGSIAPIYRPHAGAMRRSVMASPYPGNPDYRGIYLEGIGAGHPDLSYAEVFRRTQSAGFTLYRSPRDEHVRYTEMWCAVGQFCLAEHLRGLPRRDLVQWLHEHICPGVIEFVGERWCLTTEYD